MLETGLGLAIQTSAARGQKGRWGLVVFGIPSCLSRQQNAVMPVCRDGIVPGLRFKSSPPIRQQVFARPQPAAAHHGIATAGVKGVLSTFDSGAVPSTRYVPGRVSVETTLHADALRVTENFGFCVADQE